MHCPILVAYLATVCIFHTRVNLRSEHSFSRPKQINKVPWPIFDVYALVMASRYVIQCLHGPVSAFTVVLCWENTADHYNADVEIIPHRSP